MIYVDAVSKIGLNESLCNCNITHFPATLSNLNFYFLTSLYVVVVEIFISDARELPIEGLRKVFSRDHHDGYQNEEY